MKAKGFKKIAIFLALALIFTIFAACSSTENGGVKEQDSLQEEENLAEDGQTVQEEAEGEEADAEEEEAEKEDEASFPVEITDVLGRTVKMEKEPERIVSITPSSTEILFALGLGDKVVAVSNQCDYPEEAQSKEKVGDYYQPNYEQIAAAEPDLVFIGNAAPAEALEKFEELGLIVVSLEAVDFEGTYQSILDTGKLTGALDKAQEIVEDMKQKVKEIEEKVKDAPKPSTYFVVSYGEWGNYTAGKGSFIDELITMAGGRNIAGDVEQKWPEFSLERLVEEDPEVVIISENANVEEIKSLEGYKELTAVKEGNLKSITESVVMRPGPRLVEGLELIAKAIHPELFE